MLKDDENLISLKIFILVYIKNFESISVKSNIKPFFKNAFKRFKLKAFSKVNRVRRVTRRKTSCLKVLVFEAVWHSMYVTSKMLFKNVMNEIF